ncbi:FecCD family ABC transporter permease [Actinomycetota bacterium]
MGTLTFGRLGLSLAELGDLVTGGLDGRSRIVATRLRGPRLVTALGAGAALGMGGALMQSATRNPLGSPDVIGITAGAGAGAAAATLFAPGSPGWVGALAGAGLAAVIAWLATGSGYRAVAPLVLAGVGIAAVSTALTQYAVTMTLREQASTLAGYLAGSLNARGWEHAATAAATAAVLGVAAGALSRRLTLLELGDQLADGLGGQAARTRTLAIGLGVLLTAGAVAAAGPIAFVSLTAPQIARYLAGAARWRLPLSAAVGAVVLSGADLIAAQASWADGLPVGVLTAALGGAYLAALLTLTWRKGLA